MYGCSKRMSEFDEFSKEGIQSCNVTAKIEILAMENGSEFVMDTNIETKLQVIRPSVKNYLGEEVLYTSMKSCSSSSMCASDECCFNDRCWHNSLVSQCLEDGIVNGNLQTGENCNSECGVPCVQECNMPVGGGGTTIDLPCGGSSEGDFQDTQGTCQQYILPINYNMDCHGDCPDDEGYGSFIDECLVCVGGNTGLDEKYLDRLLDFLHEKN